MLGARPAGRWTGPWELLAVWALRDTDKQPEALVFESDSRQAEKGG